MKKLIIKLFRFELMQQRWGRKYIGGNFYYMGTALPMSPFWTDKPFDSCQAIILKEEKY